MAIQTLCELFYGSVDGFERPEQLRYKRDGAWRAVSSDELRAAVEEIAMGLASLGIDKGDHVAILSENRPEWAFADMAVLALGGADVPIYPSLPAAQVRYILARLGSEGRVRLERQRRPRRSPRSAASSTA